MNKFNPPKTEKDLFQALPRTPPKPPWDPLITPWNPPIHPQTSPNPRDPQKTPEDPHVVDCARNSPYHSGNVHGGGLRHPTDPPM